LDISDPDIFDRGHFFTGPNVADHLSLNIIYRIKWRGTPYILVGNIILPTAEIFFFYKRIWTLKLKTFTQALQHVYLHAAKHFWPSVHLFFHTYIVYILELFSSFGNNTLKIIQINWNIFTLLEWINLKCHTNFKQFQYFLNYLCVKLWNLHLSNIWLNNLAENRDFW